MLTQKVNHFVKALGVWKQETLTASNRELLQKLVMIGIHGGLSTPPPRLENPITREIQAYSPNRLLKDDKLLEKHTAKHKRTCQVHKCLVIHNDRRIGELCK